MARLLKNVQGNNGERGTEKRCLRSGDQPGMGLYLETAPAQQGGFFVEVLTATRGRRRVCRGADRATPGWAEGSWRLKKREAAALITARRRKLDEDGGRGERRGVAEGYKTRWGTRPVFLLAAHQSRRLTGFGESRGYDVCTRNSHFAHSCPCAAVHFAHVSPCPRRAVFGLQFVCLQMPSRMLLSLSAGRLVALPQPRQRVTGLVHAPALLALALALALDVRLVHVAASG